MKQITISDIRALNPCYDPAEYAPEDWTGTVADILKADSVPPEDRIWVAIKLLDGKTNRLFAVWCAREALKLIKNPDPRSIAACDVAEDYANGKASLEELTSARAAARAAAWAAARAAARAAAWAAAWAAASDAAWAAARAAARATAGAAASDAAWEKQCEHLAMMVEGKE